MDTRFLLAAAVALAALLSGCAAPPAKPSPTVAVVEPDRSLPPQQQIADWLTRAETEASPLREQLQLQAAELLMQESQIPRVEEILSRIDPATLPPELAVQHTLITARILRNDGDFASAVELLTAPELTALADQTSLRRQLQVSQLRASLYSLLGLHLESVQERIYMDPLLTPEQQRINREGIWNSLAYVPIDELVAHLHSANDIDYIGWLELASISKGNQGDLDAQIRQLQAWRGRWPGHPAAGNLPGGLASLTQMAALRPDSIALLLPVTDSLATYGKAIRDGFMASYYQTRASGGTVPLVRVYDTAAGTDIGAVYQRAVSEGAQLVIGPLRKEAVQALVQQSPILPVPVLALNRIEGDYFPAGLYQFGLAPEDEARQIAEIASREGHQRAMLLMPQGNWGAKVAEAFAQKWLELGGELIARAAFENKSSYSNTIRDILYLDRSQERARALEQALGRKLEFLPRRRTDIDFIFLVARPDEAQALKPLLAFHYAGDVPVYATSHVYNGVPAPDKNRDIDGIKFIDIPWVLRDNLPERDLILKELPKSRAYQRMYALGVDSFRLYPRLTQLGSLDNGRVYGETGNLSLNDQRQIERELQLAVFQRGYAKVIPIADNTLDIQLSTGSGTLTKVNAAGTQR